MLMMDDTTDIPPHLRPAPLSEASPDGFRWLAVVAKPRQEQWARDQLNAQGYRAIWPHVHHTVWRARPRSRSMVKVKTIRGLYGRYLFCGLLPWQGAMAIESTLGVDRVIKWGDGRIWWVRPNDMVRLLARLGPDGYVEIEDKIETVTSDYAVGDWAPVIEGPFRDFTGLVARVDKSGRVDVELQVFGRPTLATFERASLGSPIKASSSAVARPTRKRR